MERIAGFVKNFIFRSPNGAYRVFVLETEDGDEVCVGNCADLSEGENIEAEGEIVEHASYGPQFKISSYAVVTPKDSASVLRYLESGAIKGIGPALAQRIIKKFGDDAMRIIEEEPERLAEVKGISQRKAMEIAEQCAERRDLREALFFLQKYGITNNMAVRIFETYGGDIYNIMQKNPYKLAEDVDGIGFNKADEIALAAGLKLNSEYRIQSGLLYTLQLASGEGNTYLPREVLLERAVEILELDRESVSKILDDLSLDKRIIIRNDNVYLDRFFYSELMSARLLLKLNEYKPEECTLPSQVTAIEKKITSITESLNMDSDELQFNAVMTGIENSVFILSGGPGTGKTATINILIKYFESEGLDIMLAAPTGRAAKRITETTGYEARTIHRLLELTGYTKENGGQSFRFERNAENPLETDVLIVDEMSMVDIGVFNALLKAIAVGTRLIMVGDVDQLPSVGAGQVLKDLIESKAFPMVVLKRIFRQAGESDIIVNAHRVNEGKELLLKKDSKDFFLMERDDVNVIYQTIVGLVARRLPDYVKASRTDIQVLTPMRKGALGCESLNRILQANINPPDYTKKEIVSGDHIFRVGDKVMQIRNNYQLEWEILGKYGFAVDSGTGVFNGDTGIIKEIKDGSMVVSFDEGKQVTYNASLLEELELAYAVTVHKSQGSEYPAVIIPILSGPRQLLYRNLLYTAITRAKKIAILIGSKETVDQMILNESENKRYSSLRDRIGELNAGRN